MKPRAYTSSDIPFDTEHFKKLKNSGVEFPIDQTFENIYRNNHWQGNLSVSGAGSDDIQTKVVAGFLPQFLRKYSITEILDAPCGDFQWMKNVDLSGIQYIGGDIVREIAEKNQSMYGNEQRRFLHLDITNDPLPDAGSMLCRDCLVHLSFTDIFRMLKNFRNSSIKYLITTTFPERTENYDIVTGDWRTLNFQKEPFNFPEPLLLINEGCTEGDGIFADKSLGVWERETIRF